MIESKTHVLVTGGAGFIGSHLVEYLVHNEAQVTVIDNLSSGFLDNLQTVLSEIKLIKDDLGNVLRSKTINISDFQFIFHLAANPYIPPSVDDPVFDYNANLHTTFMLLEALRINNKPPRLINISSAAVYGNPVRLPISETDPTVPISPYGVSKLAAERYVAVYSQIYGIKATSLRFFSVYGPRQRKQVVYDIFCKLHTNPELIHLLGNGSQSRDFTYVDDIVQAMVIAAKFAPGKGEVYNVASGKSYTIADLVSICCEVCNLSPKVMYSGQVRPGDAQNWAVDIKRLEGLGFEPRISLNTGLRFVRDWFYETVQ